LHADPPPGAITYVEWLQRQIADGGRALSTCGPPVADWPALPVRFWPFGRPNAEAEAQLERQLRVLEAGL
jgi:hypothetical protein